MHAQLRYAQGMGEVIVYALQERDGEFEFIASIQQDSDRPKRELLGWACPLGKPANHHGMGWHSSYADTLEQLKNDTFWDESEKQKLRTFIEANG